MYKQHFVHCNGSADYGGLVMMYDDGDDDDDADDDI